MSQRHEGGEDPGGDMLVQEGDIRRGVGDGGGSKGVHHGEVERGQTVLLQPSAVEWVREREREKL